MNTKTCKRCGWVYPITQPGTKCKICGERFETIICNTCSKPFAYNGRRTTCPACESKLTIKSRKKRTDAMEERFKQWLDKVRQVPKDYPTLTEAQWLEACRFFNGCARCHSEEIDTRGFFVGREQGGRYCDWNVIPLCTKCAKMWQLDKSMFIYAWHKDIVKGDKRYKPLGVSDSKTEFRDSLEKLVSYLEVRLNNAIRIHGDTAGSTEGSQQDDYKHGSI